MHNPVCVHSVSAQTGIYFLSINLLYEKNETYFILSGDDLFHYIAVR